MTRSTWNRAIPITWELASNKILSPTPGLWNLCLASTSKTHKLARHGQDRAQGRAPSRPVLWWAAVLLRSGCRQIPGQSTRSCWLHGPGPGVKSFALLTSSHVTLMLMATDHTWEPLHTRPHFHSHCIVCIQNLKFRKHTSKNHGRSYWMGSQPESRALLTTKPSRASKSVNVWKHKRCFYRAHKLESDWSIQ